MSSNWKEFTKGIFRENPVFVVVLGLCPTLAVTTQTINGIAMGVAVIFVLVLSNMIVAMLRRFIPPMVRIPSYIMVIASFVTLVSLILQAYAPDINKALGIFIPLIVVNCLILGRAEAFAGKVGKDEEKGFKPWAAHVWRSILDGLGMGLGFTVSLTLIAVIREIVGNGTIDLRFAGSGVLLNFGVPQTGDAVLNVAEWITHPAVAMILPPGGFLVMGLLLAFFQFSKNRKKERERATKTAKAAAK